MRKLTYALLAMPAALALAACGGTEEQKTYEADITDESGGELVVTQDDPNAVDVDLPETEMTPVAVETEAAEAAPAE